MTQGERGGFSLVFQGTDFPTLEHGLSNTLLSELCPWLQRHAGRRAMLRVRREAASGPLSAPWHVVVRVIKTKRAPSPDINSPGSLCAWQHCIYQPSVRLLWDNTAEGLVPQGPHCPLHLGAAPHPSLQSYLLLLQSLQKNLATVRLLGC